MTKTCSKCGETKSYTEFSVRERSEAGAVVKLNRRCKACKNAVARANWHKQSRTERRARYARSNRVLRANSERLERKRKYDRERRRAIDTAEKTRAKRRYKAKLYANPKRHAAYLESERIGYALRKERKGEKVAYGLSSATMSRECEQVVPAAPLASFLRVHALESGLDARSLARAARVDESGVQKILAGKKQGVYLSLADALLVPLGFNYRHVYPELD